MFVSSVNNHFHSASYGGIFVDPLDDEILATTDAQNEGRYACVVTVMCEGLDSSMAQFVIHHRDSDDVNDLDALIVSVPTDSTKQFECAFNLSEDERITVTPLTSLVGNVVASLNWQRLS